MIDQPVPGPPARQSRTEALNHLRSELHAEFPDATDRLAQLDAHLATVGMVIDHLYDEAERVGAGVE